MVGLNIAGRKIRSEIGDDVFYHRFGGIFITEHFSCKRKKSFRCHCDPATGRPNLIWLDRLHKHIFICLFVVKTPEGLSGGIQTANSFDIFLFPTNLTVPQRNRSVKRKVTFAATCFADSSLGMWGCARILRWYLGALKGKRQSARLQQVQWHARNKEPWQSRPAAQFLLLPAARWDNLSLAKCQGHDSLRCLAGNNPPLPSKQMKPRSGVIYWRWKAKKTLYAFRNGLNKHQTCKHTYIKHQSWRYSFLQEENFIDQW